MYHKANLNRIMSDYTGQPIEKVGERRAGAARRTEAAGGREAPVPAAPLPTRKKQTFTPSSPPPHPLQIEEDTDRDRYMSPLEAKAYGLIDHIVGGDEAVFKVRPRGGAAGRGQLFVARSMLACVLVCPGCGPARVTRQGAGRWAPGRAASAATPSTPRLP